MIYHIIRNMEGKIKSYDLKLPSLAVIVTPKNIWETSICIANFGKSFTDDELAKTGTPINEKNLSRILSYLRYLGFLKATKDKVNPNSLKGAVQIWSQSDNKEVQDFYYYLQDGRMDEAKKIFNRTIKQNDIFQAVKNELFNNNRVVTETDLRDYFRRKIQNKSINYYKNGTHFVINLFLFCEIIFKENNKLKLSDSDDHSEQNDDMGKNETPDNVQKRGNDYKPEKAVGGKPDFKMGEIEIYMKKTLKNLEILKRMIPLIEFEINENNDNKESDQD